MKKSSLSISLVLIGSAALVAGCRSQTDEEQEGQRHVGGGYVGTRYVGGSGYRGGGVGGGSVSSGASARGGFGGTAHASGVSS